MTSPEHPASLIEPSCLEGLIDVVPLAPDGPGGFRGFHPILAQRSKLVRLRFRLNNRRGTIDVNASNAVHESSFFVIQIRGLDVAYNNHNTTGHRYICHAVQGCHSVQDTNKFASTFGISRFYAFF